MRRIFLAMAIATAVVVRTEIAHCGTTDFPYRDGELLARGQKDGGRVFVPDGIPTDQQMPVVIVLHGTNGSGTLHRWLSGREDLRPAFESWVREGKIGPAILAAPSQTTHATTGSSLWPGFEWATFLHEVDTALAGRASTLPARAIVVGHSGAGCNSDGGLLGIAKQDRTKLPLALIAVDTCLDEQVAISFSRVASHTSVGVFYQSQAWPRDVDGFLSALHPSVYPGRIVVEHMTENTPDPHNTIMPSALLRALQRLIPPAPVSPDELTWTENNLPRASPTSWRAGS